MKIIGKKIRVYIDTPYLFIRRNNTDWAYLRNLKHLESHIDVEIIYPFNITDILLYSFAYVASRLRIPPQLRPKLENRVIQAHKLIAKNIDAIVSHSTPPRILGGNIPLIWQYAIIDPDMQRSCGRTTEQIEKDVSFFQRMLPRATLVQVSTEAEQKRHAASFPGCAPKFAAASFFMPRLRPLQRSRVISKHATADRIRVLFVGREGRRKGLDIVASAIARMSPRLRQQMHLTVVSKEVGSDWFRGMPVDIYPSLPNAEVRRQMELSHIFVMPSRLESFGLVFVEAMAAGCAVIAPDWEAQREITDYGLAGICVRPEAEAVCAALSELIEDADKRALLAMRGHERFVERYSPTAVAAQYLDIISNAVKGVE